MFYNDYIIAAHRMRVDGLRLLTAVSGLTGFDIFKADSPGDPRFIASSSPQAEAPEIPSDAIILYESGKEGYKSRFAKKVDGGYFFESSSEDGHRIVFETDKEATRSVFYGDFKPDLLRFALWLAYGLAVVPLMTVSLHTSCILYKEKVVLFLGESGTGKSTHSRLWIENIDGATLFNDDSPILRVVDGEIIAYGSPWSGKSMCYLNESYPVAACVRLSQAPFNKISKLSIPRAYAALHPSCPPDFAYDNRLYDYVSDFLGEMVSEVPVYKMEALPDAEAAFTSCNAIFGSCLKN